MTNNTDRWNKIDSDLRKADRIFTLAIFVLGMAVGVLIAAALIRLGVVVR